MHKQKKLKNLDIKIQIFTYFDEGKKIVIAKENSINKASLRLLFEKYCISFMPHNMSQPKVPLKLGQIDIFPDFFSHCIFKISPFYGWMTENRLDRQFLS